MSLFLSSEPESAGDWFAGLHQTARRLREISSVVAHHHLLGLTPLLSEDLQ